MPIDVALHLYNSEHRRQIALAYSCTCTSMSE